MKNLGRALSSNEAGFLLLVSAIAWSLLSTGTSGGSAWPEIALLLAVGGAYVAATALGRVARWLPPAIVVGAAVALVMVAPVGVFGRGALQGPFHYANAKGSFFAVASLAGLMVAVAAPTRAWRYVGAAAALLCAVVPFAIGSTTAGILVVVLGPAALAAAAAGRSRRFVLAVGVVSAAALVSTIVLGSLVRPSGRQPEAVRLAATVLSERRPALWHDAWTLMREHPVLGVGPGRFQVTSPIALSDADARWAHNEFLQQGAEQGVTGLVLLVLGFAWGFARLAASHPGRYGALGAAVLATLAVHASVDYVLHFAAIPVAVATLVGAARIGARPAGSNRPLVHVEGNGHVHNVPGS